MADDLDAVLEQRIRAYDQPSRMQIKAAPVVSYVSSSGTGLNTSYTGASSVKLN